MEHYKQFTATLKNFHFAATLYFRQQNKKIINPEDIVGIIRWSNPKTGKSTDIVSLYIDFDSIESELRNLLRSSFASVVIQADSSLEQKFGVKAFQCVTDAGAPYRDLRCLLYMLRCACAHNPAYPIWEVKGVFKDKTFHIPELEILFDTQNRDGKEMEVTHDLGGWDSMLRLMDYVGTVLGA